jgi:hypothetical protein
MWQFTNASLESIASVFGVGFDSKNGEAEGFSNTL